MTYIDNVRYCGRIRAAGCRLQDVRTMIPDEPVRHCPTGEIVKLILEALSRRRQWSPRSMKLAIAATMRRHHILGHDLAGAIGMEESMVSKALVWELDVVNIARLAERLGYEPRGPEDFPTFVKREGPAPQYETVPRDQVVDMLRHAVRVAGKSAYALRAGGISADLSGLSAAVRGEKEIPTRFLEPIGIERRGSEFVREVRP